jgi:DNA-binding NtrC family response regulator
MTLCTTTKFFEGRGNFSTEAIAVPEKEPFWKRILIIDDETDITIALKKALTDNGFEQVDTFNDPLLALKSFKVDLYGLIILDIIMPEIDGFELYEQMRSIDNDVKVCFITAFEVNLQALKAVYSTATTTDDLGYFIRNLLKYNI